MEDDFGIIDLSKPLEEDKDQTDDFGISVMPEPTQTDDFGIPDLSVVSDAPPVSVSDQPSLKSDALPIDPAFNPFKFNQEAQAAYDAAVNRDYYTPEQQAIELAKQAEGEAQKKAYLAERDELKTQILQEQMLNPAPNVDIPVIGGEFDGGPRDFSTAFKYGDLRTQGNIQNLFADTEVELGGTGFMQFNQNMQNKLLPVINSVRSLVGAEPLPKDASLRASIMKEIELERSAKSYLKAAEGLGFKPQRFGEIEGFADFFSWAKTTAGASGSPMLVSMASAGLLSPVVLGAELDANLREIEGLSREDRIKLSYRGGLIAGLLENLGIGILIKGIPDAVVGKLGIETIQKYAQKRYGTRVANQIVQVGIAEGLIEVGQEGTFIAIESGAGKEFKPGEKAERLTESLVGGAVIGGPLGGARAAVTETSSKADKEAKAFIDSIDQAEFDQTPEQAALAALSDPTNEILVDAPQVKTEVQQPTVDSAASDTVDVTAQPDPSLTSDVPTDLTAPPKAEPPKVDTTPIEKPEVKTEFPQPNKSGVYSSDDVKPEDNFYNKLPGPAYTEAELQVLQIAPDKWITRSGISFSESGGSDPFNERNTFPTREAAILDLVQKKRINETIREGDTKIVQRQKKAFGKFLDKILKDNGITPPTIDTTPIEKPEVKTEPPVKPVAPEQKDETPPAAAPITKTNTREITSQLDQVNLEAFIDTLRDKEAFNLRKGKNADDASPEELNKMLDEITQQEQIFTKFDRASIKKQEEIFAFLDEEISYYEESGRKAIPGFVDKEGKQLYYNQLSWAFTNYKEYLENLKTSRSKVDTKPPKPVKEKPPEVNPQEAAPIGTDTDGQVTSVQTPDGQKNYNVTGKVVELADLKQAQGDLQPRDRSKKESTALAVQRAGTMFNPQRLLNDPTSGSGAPIIARDGTIMSGNGRVLTMQEVYANQPKSLEAYQNALKEAGINTEGFSQPVFVRQLNDNMTVDQLKEFADLSNTEAQAQMTSTETAQRDAKRMPQNLINLYTGGDITSAENKSFVTGFAVQVLSPTEQGQFSVDGKPTKNAISRMQAAILATAYDDTDTLSIMLDSTDENIKAISNAMMASAPQLSQLKADIKDGNVKSDFDISNQIAEAAKTISNLRDQKVKPRDYFDQQDAFSQTDPLTEAIIKAFYNEELTRAKSQKFMTDVLNFYVQESGKRQENALFEDEVTPKDVVTAARKKAERKADGTDENQGSLLAEASPSKSVNESRKQAQSPKRKRSSKRLDAEQPAAEAQEDELGGSTSDPSNVVTTTSGFVFDNVSQTLRQSIYRDAFADSGLSVDAIENKSTEAKFKILAEAVKDKFGLSGVKAPKGGGYTQVNQLLDAYHNLQWMTHSLAMPNTFIGLNGKLSLELPDTVGRYLGAFESGSNNVIMPQRSNSFAHEFGHALDYYLMDKYGNLGFMESSRGISGLIRATAKAGDRPWQNGTPVNVETAFGNMINALFLDNAELSYKIMQLEQAIAKGEAREAKTGVTTKSLEKLRSQLQKLLEGSGRSKVSPTKFKETSAQFGASVNMKDYYLRPTEMFARAFEAYIARTVEAAGGRNEFITKGDEAYKLAAEQVKGADDRLALAYPKDEERHNIFLAMDRLMDALRAESIAEGTVAEAPGDTDMIDARANFWGSMQYEERNNMRDIPKRVVQSILNDQKRAYRIADNRAKALKLRPQKYAGNNFLERKINEYRDLFVGNFIETKRQILFNASDQNKDNPRVRKIMENIISKIATDPGTRQNRVTKQTGTFEEAAKIESRRFYAIYDQIAKKYDMDLMTDAEQKSLRLLLTGESRATADASPKTLELAGELRRRLLNPIYDYMVKSGQDLNYVQGVGYMPRMLDAALAIQEKTDFMGKLEGDKGAVPLYRNVIFENEYGVHEEGDLDQIKALVKLAMSNPDKTNVGDIIANEYSELREIAAIMREQIQEINRLEKTVEEDPAAEAKIQEIIDSMDQEHFKLHEELRDPYALAAAEDWHTRITVREGADPSTNGVQGSYAKKRKLPPEADKYMNDFYLNPTDALMQYIPSAVRSTEYNRLFGKDLVPVGSKMKGERQIDYLEYLIDEAKAAGMPTHQAQEVDSIVKMVTGRYPAPDGSFNKALNTINTYGTMALLPRAVLSSVAEPMTAAIQTGSTVKGFQNFAYALDGLGASLRGKAAVERKMYYAQLANVLGVIDLPQTGEVVANRLGGTVAEDAKNTMRLATFFLRTGLTNITIAQRKASMRVGMQFIIEQAAQYNNPDISASLKEEARQTLRDFGINERIIKQFTEFAQNLDKTDSGLYEIDQIMDVDGSLTDMGRVLATAVNRFVDQTIQDPKIIDRPKWAETPIGRVVFGIQSFIAAFQRNVLEMSVKRAARDYKTQGVIGGSERLARKMLLPLFSLYVGHTLVSAAREFVFNQNKWEEEKEEEDRNIPIKYLMTLGISRSGLLGRLDPVFNGFFSLKYQADLSNVAVGASGAYYLKAVQRIWGLGVENSPNTVSREYQAVRGLYDIFVPALAGGLATIPGVSNTLGYGLGALDMAVTSPSVKHWVTRNIIKQATGETYRPGQSSSNRGSSGFGSGGFGSKGFGD